MMARLDIIIVNWNTGAQLRRCLESIAETERGGFELKRIVVVDNASSDGSADGLDGVSYLAARSSEGPAGSRSAPAPPVTVVRNARNEGFAAACNRGAAGSGADHLLFLNPDTRLFRDSISAALACIERAGNERVGVVGIQLVDERGNVSRSCARFPSLGTCVSRALGLHRLSKRLFPSYLMSEWDHAESREVDHVSGAFFLVRRSLFERLGGFDERFFVYLEDLDFSYRLSRAGWKSYYLAEARSFHRGGGASERVQAERLFYSTSSRMLYARKHFTRAEAAALLLVTMTLEPCIRLLSALAEGSGERARATAAAYLRLYRALPRHIQGRSAYDRSPGA